MTADSRAANSSRVGRHIAPRSLTVALLLTLGLAAGVLTACGGESEEPPPTGATLAERWLRAGEENNAGIAVYERSLPPGFADLLNPDADADTPPEDLVALPVHPDGQLLGSYILRRSDGSQIVWLFYDVPENTMAGVIDVVTGQLDTSPWQVLSQSGTRSNRVIGFENTRNEDITGNAIAENIPGASEFTIVVDRDGTEVTLTIPQRAPVPLIEAAFNNGLVVQDVFPGLARTAGLQEDDQIRRVGDTAVRTPKELESALEAMTAGPRTVALLYVLQIAPPLQAELPPFVPVPGLSLPSDFPALDVWSSFDLDRFDAAKDATGRYHFASLFSDDSPTAVANVVRDALIAAGWEIVSDEAAGFGTTLEFAHEGDGLTGIVSIDESDLDETLTQLFVQIQTAEQ